jgi:acyl-CoA dehydrogenase
MADLQVVRAFLDESLLQADEKIEIACREDIAPLPAAVSDDDAREQARVIVEILGRRGILAAIEPLDLRRCCLTRERLAATSPLADAVFALQALGAVPIALAGSDELRQRWLGPAVRGEAMGAFVMTEPGAGSDVASMTTSAVRAGGHYILNGTKTLISNAGIADFYTVFASTNPEAGSRGISAFVVPAETPGLRFLGPQVLSSPHPLGDMAFEDCHVPLSARLGDENGGFRIGMMTLDRLRPTVGAAACGMASRAMDEALTHALARRQFGQRLADFQLIQDKLARMATDLTAARLLTYRAAWEKDRGAARITVEAAMAKAFATEAAQRIIDDAIQVMGGRGVLADSVVDRLYRSVRALRIYEGTTEVQHLVIAGALIKAATAARSSSTSSSTSTSTSSSTSA